MSPNGKSLGPFNKALLLQELLKHLVSETGAWKSWSSQLHHHDRGLAQALGAFLQLLGHGILRACYTEVSEAGEDY